MLYTTPARSTKWNEVKWMWNKVIGAVLVVLCACAFCCFYPSALKVLNDVRCVRRQKCTIFIKHENLFAAVRFAHAWPGTKCWRKCAHTLPPSSLPCRFSVRPIFCSGNIGVCVAVGGASWFDLTTSTTQPLPHVERTSRVSCDVVDIEFGPYFQTPNMRASSLWGHRKWHFIFYMWQHIFNITQIAHRHRNTHIPHMYM